MNSNALMTLVSAPAQSEGAQTVATGSFVDFAVAVVALWVVTIVSILRSSYTWGIKALALLATLLFPFVSFLAWFLWVKK
ncbi:hypothetical protein AA983_04955 [Dermacoccus sp. PE3]|uniref:hypothetical protein n=1 Tax=Dermacoccus sp. PE3 TaxID=1641401 RepID=UPI000641ABEB|nr:hypothetical protein [Dermacoccus sp. PE3]KLO64017.1 hypothetical protein AA983_04955 [Dermacoccus sp. PE3]